MSEAASVPGRFVWADLMTNDLEGAKKFYFALFPTWSAEGAAGAESEGSCRFALEGRPVGAMVRLGAGSGRSSHWVPYVTVANVDDVCARAAALGGKVHVPPTDMAGIGRFALIADPHGALLSPVTLLEEPPEPSGALAQGTFCWHELVTTDPAAAKAFYVELLGWSHAEMPVDGAPYHLFRRGQRDAAGMTLQSAARKSAPAWTVYLFTSDIEASVAKVMELGGSTQAAPYHVPGVGQFAVVADPTGAVFSLFKSERA